jgi:hypothetical protein
MSGVLVDAHTGETLQTLHFDGQAMAAWEVAIPARSDLQLPGAAARLRMWTTVPAAAGSSFWCRRSVMLFGIESAN